MLVAHSLGDTLTHDSLTDLRTPSLIVALPLPLTLTPTLTLTLTLTLALTYRGAAEEDEHFPPVVELAPARRMHGQCWSW